MAEFFRSVLKHLAAIVVAFALFCFLVFLFLVGVGTLFQPKALIVEEGSVLVVDLGMKIYDSPANVDPFDRVLAALQGEEDTAISLRRLLEGLEEARKDDDISALLLIGTLASGGTANSLATLTELRGALDRFRQSGKKVYAYSETDGLGELYLKSVADEHWMDPYGLFDYRGLAAQIPYLGGIFERYGVEYQVVRAGKFKSAGEPYVKSEMSPETREALGMLLDDIWLDLRTGIAADTSLTVEALDELANEESLLGADEALEAGVVDELITFQDIQQRLIERAGFQAEGRTFLNVDLLSYLGTPSNPLEALGHMGGNQIAVVYAEGVIVDGEGDVDSVGGARFARILRLLRKDDDVKAVVLRVNSPGGSATASELIAREVELTNANKPVVVSMGGYAASGGYYISARADTIFAQPTTITGSIGVVSMLPNISALTERFDVNMETVQTNRNGTMWSLFESKDEAQLALIEDRVIHSYDLFLRHVSEGRGITLEEADAVGQGREWSGLAAKERKLVDRFGGLLDAIAYAADRAGIGDDYTVVDRPRAVTLEDLIAEAMGTNGMPMESISPLPRGILGNSRDSLLQQLQAVLEMSDRYNLYSYSGVRVNW